MKKLLDLFALGITGYIVFFILMFLDWRFIFVLFPTGVVVIASGFLKTNS